MICFTYKFCKIQSIIDFQFFNSNVEERIIQDIFSELFVATGGSALGNR